MLHWWQRQATGMTETRKINQLPVYCRVDTPMAGVTE